MKNGQDIADKYASKYDPTVVSQRYTNGKTAACAAMAEHAIAQADIAASVRGILNTAGVPLINTVRFSGYASKLYSLTNKCSGLTATNEAVNISSGWVDKIVASAGDKVVMQAIWNLFSSDLGAAPSPFPKA